MLLRNLKLIPIIAVAVIILIAVLMFFLRSPLKEAEKKMDLSRPSVIKEIRALGNLETASFTIEKIIEAGEEGSAIRDLLFGDKLLLIAHGKVIAGVDMTMLTEEDIQINGDVLSISLPAPIILSSILDNEKTKVYDRTQGYLTRGDKDLETAARKSAEESIRMAACEAGILTEARKNAIERIKQLYEFAGYTNVEIIIPEGSC